MRINNVVFIAFGALVERLNDALCIEYFRSVGIGIDYIDVTGLLFGGNIKQDYDFVRSINTYDEFENIISCYCKSSTLFNIQIHYELRFVKLFLLLRKHRCKMSIFEIGYMPYIPFDRKIKEYLKYPFDFFKRGYAKLIDIVLSRFDFFQFKYYVKFVSGNVPLRISQNNSNKVVEINYIDYEYNRDMVDVSNNSKRYFVFLDIYLYKHEDHRFVRFSNKNNFLYEKYLQNLNNFFIEIENRFDAEVIIAAHPKSNYAGYEFCNRKIIKNNTVGLVKGSYGVISHHSTSLSFAVLNYKPVIFIYDDLIKTEFTNIYMYTKVFADYLHMPCLNIDFEILETMPDVSKTKYNKYKYDFLVTENSECLTNKQIIEGFIKNEAFT